MRPAGDLKTDILVVGGGPAGMAAASAAAEVSGGRVILADENPLLGGQIWRSELRRVHPAIAEHFDRGRIDVLNSCSIAAKAGGRALLADGPKGAFRIRYVKLIIATGARERFLPFRNWTLPNIFGAGGLQALVKGGFSVKGKRVIVSGTGPLLLAVADHLVSKDARVLLIAEQASGSRLLHFAPGLIAVPEKIREAVGLAARLRGVQYRTGTFVEAAEGDSRLRAVIIRDRSGIRRIGCDLLACGYHLVPNTELGELLGCRITRGKIDIDRYQETSVGGVYSAGESNGIGGAELALAEGRIAGFAAAGEPGRARGLLLRRIRLRSFASAMEKACSLSAGLRKMAADDTILCRCEDVTVAEARSFASFREAKLFSRCGMGACQGRVCGPAAEFLFGWERNSVRPPISPVKLSTLSD